MLQEKVRPQHHSEEQSTMSLGIPNWSCSFYQGNTVRWSPHPYCLIFPCNWQSITEQRPLQDSPVLTSKQNAICNPVLWLAPDETASNADWSPKGMTNF
jgi:hypothetical protein